jgi:branched-subunit amino acid transport protein AzlD
MLRLDYMFYQLFELIWVVYCYYNADFFFELIGFDIFVVFLGIYSLHIFRKMSSGSSQRRVRQMTGE